MTSLATAKFFTKAKDISATSSGASADVIYTCPNNFVSLIRLLHVSNGDAQKKISVQWFDASDGASGTYHFIADEFKPDANTLNEVIVGGYLALEAGDKIVAFKESGGDFHITISGEEHYQPTLI